MPDRRQDPDPHPPDGVERRCSDQMCMEARNAWFMNELLPKLQVRFWIGVVATCTALSGAFFFVTDAVITKFEVRIQRDYELSGKHDADIVRLEAKIDKSVDSMKEVSDKLDRNLEYIRKTVN